MISPIVTKIIYNSPSKKLPPKVPVKPKKSIKVSDLEYVNCYTELNFEVKGKHFDK